MVAEPTIERVPEIELAFGEGLTWDDELGRLYFVDTAKNQICWLEPEAAKRDSVRVQGMPTVVRLTDMPGVLVVSLPDGLYTVDTGDGTTLLLAPLPDARAPRMNDATIDARPPRYSA